MISGATDFGSSVASSMSTHGPAPVGGCQSSAAIADSAARYELALQMLDRFRIKPDGIKGRIVLLLARMPCREVETTKERLGVDIGAIPKRDASSKLDEQGRRTVRTIGRELRALELAGLIDKSEVRNRFNQALGVKLSLVWREG
ncbi:hypothetical protein [Rosistilla oblonga]|uniref:hypothetical protein n=1 Tax=Rosistilla oblonga TaxID=2527990 RepID=UPI003A96E8EA